jgi:hypothetical protein
MKKALLFLSIVVTFNCYGEISKDSLTVKTTPVYWMFKFDAIRLINMPAGFEKSKLSFGAGVDVFYDFRFKNKKFGISPGIGYQLNNYSTNSRFITTANGSSELQAIPDSVSYTGNILNASYLTIPIEFRYIKELTDNSKSIGFGLGMNLGYLMGSSQEFTTESGNISTTVREKDLDGFAQIQYAITGRICYRRLKILDNELVGTSWSLLTSAGLSELLNSDYGPAINSFSLGIGVGFIFK